MLEKFIRHIETEFNDFHAKRLLLAVSGGIDSVVLCHLCKSANLNFAIAHCNFHLRKEDSNQDQLFVEQLASSLGVSVFVNEFETEKYAKDKSISIQIAARELRYGWFEELLNKEKYDYLLTAHHLDDSIETFLINFSRGTGLEGLLGIPKVNGNIVRPLLPFTRDEILEFAEQNEIDWREDYTNKQTKYLRNKFRIKIIPILKEMNPNFAESFEDTISYLNESHQLSEDATNWAYEKVVTKKGDEIYFSIEEIKRLSSPKAYLYRWLCNYGFTAWNDILDLLDANSGKVIYSSNFVLLKDRSNLILKEKIKKVEDIEIYYIENKQELTQPIKIKVEPYDTNVLTTDSSTILIDGNLVKFPLTIRKYKSGDSFIPYGMKGTKKVSKFFKDEKFNQFQKDATWLLCSKDEIVWIIGHRLDDRFKVRNTTNNIIKITITV